MASHWTDHFTLLKFSTLDSTNKEARRVLTVNKEHDVVFWALHQSEGRGRGTREWVSFEGNLFFSLLLQLQVNVAVVSQLSFVMALAIGRAIESLSSSEAAKECLTYKWPNDVLWDGQKISGILLETDFMAQQEQVEWIIAGVGVNVLDAPSGTTHPSTSLKLAIGDAPELSDVLHHIMVQFESLYAQWQQDGFEALRDEWMASAAGLNQIISIQLPKETLSGTFKGIDENGYLILEEQGEIRLFPSGEIFLHNES